MRVRLAKTAGFIFACGMAFSMTQLPAQAGAVSSGITAVISGYMSYSMPEISDTNTAVTKTGQTESTTICGYTNLGIANVETNLNIRETPDEAGELAGKLPKDAGCEILAEEGDWYQIQSGKVTGYVKGEYLLTGDEAKTKAADIMQTVATVTADVLNVRAEQNTECSVIARMPKGEEVPVIEEYDGWAKVEVDGEVGYICTDYVTIALQLPKAMTMTEVKYGQGVSDVRVALVSYATQFVGNPYVWGGTSLTRGADCSGFVLSVFAQYGVYLPRSSASQAGSGIKISASEAQPGDLFFYSNGKRINHVAIYIGNGQIVHASSPSTGIKISNAYYRQPVKVVRVLSD